MMLQLLRSSAIGLAILSQCVSASTIHPVARRDAKPGFPVKSDTITTCTMYYYNWLGEECKVIRDWYYAISPEDFHLWNSSISLNCGGWEDWHSYCIGVEGPSFVEQQQLDSWEPMGCFIDYFTLKTKSTREGGSTLTVDKCQAACWLDGFRFAGLKSGTECWCGTSIGGDWAKDQADCKTPCPGNDAQKCGGDKLLSVFRAVQDETPLPPGGRPPIITTTTSAAAATTTTGAAAAAIWVPKGCYKDLALTTVRPLPDRLINNWGSLTIQIYQNACRNGGYTLAGVENGNQCFCGHEIKEPATNIWVSPTEYAKPCTGNGSENYGAAARMYIYKYAAPERQVWRSLGCYKDLYPTASRTLDAMLLSGSTMTIESCHALCQDSVYKYAGLENGSHCWCGNDIRDPATNVLTVMSECGTACSGDKRQTCGRSARMHIYEYVNA